MQQQKHIVVLQKILNIIVSLFLLSGMTLNLSSCVEIEIIDHNKIQGKHITTGKDGNINFSLDFSGYGEGVDITARSAADLKAEEVVVPLGDGHSMIATLEVAPADISTRSAGLRSFEHAARMHIVAYEQTSVLPVTYTFRERVAFIVDASIPTAPTITRAAGEEPFVLSVGSTYRFVAYSYNDDVTLMPVVHTGSIENINPNLDLVWGASPPIYVSGGTGSPVDVLISMNHKFSKIRVNVTNTIASAGDITVLSQVKVLPDCKVNLDIEEGTLSLSTSPTPPDYAQTFTFSSPPPSMSLTSDYRIAYTAESHATIVKIGTVTFDNGIVNNTYNDLFATFAKKLKSGYQYNINVKFGNAGELTDDTPPTGFFPYVGAFWKNDQFGERLIRIARPTVSSAGTPLSPTQQAAADSVWSAVVVVGDDWIVLDTIPASDSVFGVPAWNGNDPGFDATPRLVTGSQTYVSGLMDDSNPEIYFRIGLTGTNPYSAPRYGMVLLTYANNTKRQRIWIRQGEAPDYLMQPGDPVVTGGISNRNAAQKFSPYNITAQQLNTQQDIQGSTPASNPGIFVDYPTQAGALYKWASANYTRFAYNPYTLNISPWNSLDEPPSGSYWDVLAPTNETCPPGYRRPSDGTIDSDDSGPLMSQSEMRQSLYLYPQTGDMNAGSSPYFTNANSVKGYYADGFFDRQPIVNAISNFSAGILSAVSNNNANVAYIGRLFWNPATYASLFFPTTGYREAASSDLWSAGTATYYWSSSSWIHLPDNVVYGWTLNIDPSTVTQFGAVHMAAFPIRCVSIPCDAIASVSLSSVPSGGGNVLTGVSIYLTATVSPPTASNVYYTWQSFNGTIWQTLSVTTTPTYQATVLEGLNQFRVVASNNCNFQTSSTVSITGVTLAGGSSARITWDDNDEKYVLTTDPRDAGLYFRFGSLVGLFSGEGRYTQDLSLPGTSGTNTSIFNSSDHVTFNITAITINTVNDVPYVSTQTELDAAYHTAANVKTGRGDPCRLVGLDLNNIKNKTALQLTQAEIDNGLWRLPTGLEQQQFSGYSTSQSGSPGIWWWAKNQSPGPISFSILGVAGGEFPSRDSGGAGKFIPAVGDRDDNGKAGRHGARAFFLTTSSVNSSNYLGFELQANRLSLTSAMKTWFWPARCVPQTLIIVP